MSTRIIEGTFFEYSTFVMKYGRNYFNFGDLRCYAMNEYDIKRLIQVIPGDSQKGNHKERKRKTSSLGNSGRCTAKPMPIYDVPVEVAIHV